MPANLENSAVVTGLEKVSFRIPKKGNVKECSNYCIIALISHASKVMLKILQARLQQYMNQELPDVQAGFRKGRRTRNQIANICWVIDHLVFDMFLNQEFSTVIYSDFFRTEEQKENLHDVLKLS